MTATGLTIGYVGNFAVPWSTEHEVAKELEKKATVDRYERSTINYGDFTAKRYDICLTPSPHLDPIEFWEEQKGLKVAQYWDLVAVPPDATGDVNWLRNRDRIYFPSLKNFDLVFAPDCMDDSRYKAAGINVVYLPAAADPKIYYPVHNVIPQYDVGFIGHAYGKRDGSFRELKKVCNFKHVGQREEYRRDGAHSTFCAQCKIMLAKNATNDVPGYWSIRVYQHLLSQAFVLHPRVEGLERQFQDGVHLVMWDDEEDLREKIEYYRRRPSERKRIARQGYQQALEVGTWDKRMEEFWSHVLRSLRTRI